MPLWNWKRGRGDSPKSETPALPRPGEPVRLDAAGDSDLGVYQAQVRAVGLRRLVLETAEGTMLPPRTPLTLSWARGEALYRGETRVIGRLPTGTLAVARPRQVTRVQRRQFYRLPLESPTTFRVLTPDDRLASPPVAARLVNLSGGGALLASPKPVPAGLAVVVRVPAGRESYLMDVEAEALDCQVVGLRAAARTYLVRVRFFGPPRLSEDGREAIVAYIAEQQRIMLRARKLLRA